MCARVKMYTELQLINITQTINYTYSISKIVGTMDKAVTLCIWLQ